MATIYTKYHGPTNNQGARISVRGWSGRAGREVKRFYSFNYRDEDAHNAAVRAWWAEWGQGDETLVRGSTPDDRGWVYLSVDNSSVSVQGRE